MSVRRVVVNDGMVIKGEVTIKEKYVVIHGWTFLSGTIPSIMSMVGDPIYIPWGNIKFVSADVPVKKFVVTLEDQPPFDGHGHPKSGVKILVNGVDRGVIFRSDNVNGGQWTTMIRAENCPPMPSSSLPSAKDYAVRRAERAAREGMFY